MQLPWRHESLARLNLNEQALTQAILERRNIIRASRDAKGDDRCWVDDWPIWSMLDDTNPEPSHAPPIEVAMQICEDFYLYRRADTPDPISPDAILEPAYWDNDLATMSAQALYDELVRIQKAILEHRQNPAGIESDRSLYSTLPEKLPADFRLPPREEFLGEAKAPHAGCPPFWRSHDKCPRNKLTPCNLHKWGPCAHETP